MLSTGHSQGSLQKEGPSSEGSIRCGNWPSDLALAGTQFLHLGSEGR